MATGIHIFQDFQENQNARKSKRDDVQGKAPAIKRAALGTITNTTRIQPTRAAKQPANTFLTIGGDENIAVSGKTFSVNNGPKQTQTFTIHCDENIQPVQPQTKINSRAQTGVLQLHTDVTNLQPSRPSMPKPIAASPEESPMVLDTSIDLQQCREESQEERSRRILTVPEYSEDIYKYLKEAEQRYHPKPGYMKKQPDVTSSMRSILVDWLVEVAEEYKLHRETLCLAVNYIDRFLSQMSVLRGKLQLVGAASMFLAAKYEEIYPPEVGEFVYITDDTYTQQQVLRMEHLILKVLSFDVAVPTINCFTELFLQKLGADAKTQSLAMYLAELTLVDGDTFLKYLPSQLSAACICLANHTLGNDTWPFSMVQNTGYDLRSLAPCLTELYTTFCQAPNHPQQAIREKYKQSKYHQVSLLCPPPNIPSAQ